MTKESTLRASTSVASRPRPVTLACLLVVFIVATDIAGPLLPSSEGNIVFGIVASLITSVAAVGLWALRRWGYVATLVVVALTLLSDAPVIGVGSTGLIKVWAAAAVLACVFVIVFATRPEARPVYH